MFHIFIAFNPSTEMNNILQYNNDDCWKLEDRLIWFSCLASKQHLPRRGDHSLLPYSRHCTPYKVTTLYIQGLGTHVHLPFILDPMSRHVFNVFRISNSHMSLKWISLKIWMVLEMCLDIRSIIKNAVTLHKCSI